MGFSGISTPMRDLLIEHLDGRRVPIVVHVQARMDLDRSKSMWALLRRGLIKWYAPGGHRPDLERPRFSVITDKGHQALSRLLADYADAIVRARMMRQAGGSRFVFLPPPENAPPEHDLTS